MKKSILIVAFLFIFTSLCFSGEAPDKGGSRDYPIAVFDIDTKGKVDKNIAHPLSEMIRAEAVGTGKYKVIDRSNMHKIFEEQKFQMATCVSGECMVQAGKLLGVSKIVTGSISILGQTYVLSLSLINVETGEIEAGITDECKCRVDELISSSKKAVKKLFGGQASVQIKGFPLDMEMVFVKGGCFQMGDSFGDGALDEKPMHEVCVNDFYIGKYEVTQGQWKELMWNNPSYFAICGDDCPVEFVSWKDVQEFIKRLNEKTTSIVPINKGGAKGLYRLPTEAEWEFACKSGGKKEKWAGANNEADLSSYAWFDINSGGITHPVGKKKPNGLGIYDMSGNVWEWVQDVYSQEAYQYHMRENPVHISSGENRVKRGGSCYPNRKVSRCSGRSYYLSSHGYHLLGFRLAMTP